MPTTFDYKSAMPTASWSKVSWMGTASPRRSGAFGTWDTRQSRIKPVSIKLEPRNQHSLASRPRRAKRCRAS